MIIVGLTGGIGSGKTTVANYFKKLGVPVYIADDCAKELMLKNPIKREIINLFGAESYNSLGKLNRKYLASKAFNNKEQLEKLNKIVHPRVREDLELWVKKQEAPYVLYEAAILFESKNYQSYIDYSIVVTAPKNERIKRIKKRDQISDRQIEARMKNQWSQKRKEKLADWVIVNRDFAKTEKKVVKLHHILSNL